MEQMLSEHRCFHGDGLLIEATTHATLRFLMRQTKHVVEESDSWSSCTPVHDMFCII